jgi:ABC-2 type transport system ATP-binding protein
MLIASNHSDQENNSQVAEAPAIYFENVSVRYRVPRESLSGIKEFAIRWLQRRILYEDFWALRQVSFSIQPGEVFGIIGHNGAGKSTLLKVMAQVLKPVAGRVVMRGKVAPLLELGGGFHPELTGRENVYMNMALLGHSRRQTDVMFDDIVDFAELREFIDAPLRTYSTGMVARLGFSVATCLQPEILLVDEILSVGDSQFQQKCLERMQSFQTKGTTIVIVSHGMGALESLCKRALHLEKGQVKSIGPVEQVVEAYIAEDKPEMPQPDQSMTFVIPSPPEPRPVSAPQAEDGYVVLDEEGGIYPAQKIFDPLQGAVTLWLRIKHEFPPKDAVIFHTDDSRYLIYISLQYSVMQKRYIRRLVGRAGGNRRVIDTYYGTTDFPEVGVIIEQEALSKTYLLDYDTWYPIAMTWQGYPSGKVSLYVNDDLIGEKAYDPRYDRGDNLPSSIAVGMRPNAWTGELVVQEDGKTTDLRPTSLMWIGEGGIEIKDLRLYKRSLNPEDVQQIFKLEQAPGSHKS